MNSVISESISEHVELVKRVQVELAGQISTCAEQLINCLSSGGKVFICGNGGSAADAQHFAAELVGRFEIERCGLPAIALTTDSSILTAVGNDYGFEWVFSRQLEALANEKDLFVGISTSGNSGNVLAAIKTAKQIGCRTLALIGHDGGNIASEVDCSLIVPAQRTARIQEMHLLIIHILCELIDTEFKNH
ncbi:D-sedoheptulose 7-phosphate isomerase [Deltaproteobacteria bacterium]|nr:D-sedoheptulose 7-phosphate isomerase [Deltaproteobacteria bacterium]